MIECPDSCSSHFATSIYFCFLLGRLLSFSLRADTEGIVLARVKANDADCTISNLLLLPIVGSKLLAFSLRADTDEGIRIIVLAPVIVRMKRTCAAS